MFVEIYIFSEYGANGVILFKENLLPHLSLCVILALTETPFPVY